jgi:cobalt/nickel transport system ATP-binding protein
VVTAYIELVDVSVRVGATDALRSVSLTVRVGERVALLGLNGSGKTSLLLALAGLVPHAGRITIGGQLLDERSAKRLRLTMGFVFAVPEDQLLFPEVLDDVVFGLVQRGVGRDEARQRALATLSQLAAEALAHRATHELSHGERLRVALAGAVATHPDLLLLDEPSAGLDPPARRQLAELLDGLRSTQLIATHDVPFARRSCQRFVQLESGRVVAEGTMDELPRDWWE